MEFAEVERVLFRLPELMAASADEVLIVVEGERDVLTLVNHGFTATTNSGGAAQKWQPQYTVALAGRDVVVIPDNDEPGRKHAAEAAEALVAAGCHVRIVEVPGGNKDVSDWFAAGANADDLRALAGAQPVLTDELLGAVRARWGIGDRALTQPLDSLLIPLRNDSGNAVRLIKACGRDLHYCPPMRKWLVWDGMRWAVDDRGAALQMAKQTMMDYFAEAVEADEDEHIKFACGSLNARRIVNTLSMAECELIVMPDELDRWPFLLNFLNGEVDLETGLLLPHKREHLITKLVHYNYNPLAKCPLFMAFVARIMGNHPDASEAEFEKVERMVSYLQRAFGYSLTGSTEEKAVFVLFGAGTNGKTTLLSTFSQLLKEYAVLLQVDSLMTTRETSNSQADLADLRGARFVMTSETEEGQRLAQGKLKRITQGMGTVKAVRKYENPIEFAESHKLWMDTNRKPTIRDVDDNATFNRLHPIPFAVTIPPDEVDKSLPRKMLAEAEGILAWAVAGAVEWRRIGLSKPPEVDAGSCGSTRFSYSAGVVGASAPTRSLDPRQPTLWACI